MLLAVDVGNTNTVLGLYVPGAARGLVTSWRIRTPVQETVDEFGVLLRNLFALRGREMEEVTGVAVSSVVPPLDAMLREVLTAVFAVPPMFVGPGAETGVPVLTDNPAEVGADRLMNCVAAIAKFPGLPVVVVDLGTATTFDVVSARGEFLGGAIAPGLGISAEALFSRASMLPRIEIGRPAKVIGTGTIDNIQIGLYYGYIGLVDGILERMLAELGRETRTVATGGLAKLIAGGSRFLEEVDEMLTLDGLRLVWERSQASGAADRQ